MIINTIISGSSARNNISLSSPELVLFLNEGDNSELQFNYLNSKSLDGAATLFYNDEIIEAVVIESGQSDIFDIQSTLQLGGTGLYKFRIIVTDSEASIDFLEFSVLYNYQNIDDFSFVYDAGSNGYILTQYTGTSPDVTIPPLFVGEEGSLPVVRIADRVFFDKDSLLSVNIPETVQSIGSLAFFSCTNLREVTVLNETPPVLDADNVFDPYNELSLLTIKVPSVSVQDYKGAEHWDEYTNVISAVV
jgi:hypothetical protein